MSHNLYFDNSATSHPKPKELEAAAISYLNRGGNYGRASYQRAIDNTKTVEKCRQRLADMFGVSDDNIFFTKNATESANLVINALDLRGKRVLCSKMEHNAIMRPLKSVGADIELIESHSDGLIDISKLREVDFSTYDLVCVNHVSNVNGVVQPISQIAQIIGDSSRLLIDASQSAGAFDFNFVGDYVVFTGHKSLFGVVGVGGFYAKNPQTLTPLIYGGTGSNSESYDMPSFAPDKFEAGTINILGIEMLLSAIENHPTALHSREDFCTLLTNLSKIDCVELFTASSFENQAELFSLKFKGLGVSTSANKIYELFGIEIRKGLHCSPLAHKTLNTFAEGTLRFSLSPYHTKEDLDYLYEAIKSIAIS